MRSSTSIASITVWNERPSLVETGCDLAVKNKSTERGAGRGDVITTSVSSFYGGLHGCVHLVVEILGAKMLSPFLVRPFVWTAQIAVTLVALSGGYYAGGWLVDQSPKLNRCITEFWQRSFISPPQCQW